VVGAKIATYLLGRLNYQGNILMQRYEQHVGTRIRGKVMDIELSENTGVKLLATHTMARSASWQDDVRKGMEALLLKHKGEVNAIWASFDGQAFIIDDILQQMGFKKGQVLLTGVDGGKEADKRIRNPESLFTATIDIPYEKMAREAVDAMEKIVVKKLKKSDVVQGPFLFVEPVLIDSTNVPRE
jgi:ABC-type xylose transport system substrate-binding protein